MKSKRIAPKHPGFYLRELLEELGLSQYRLAKDIGVPAMRINYIVKEARPVTAEMALRLGLFFRQTPQYWLNLQARHDMDCAMDSLGDELKSKIAPLEITRSILEGGDQARRAASRSVSRRTRPTIGYRAK